MACNIAQWTSDGDDMGGGHSSHIASSLHSVLDLLDNHIDRARPLRQSLRLYPNSQGQPPEKRVDNSVIKTASSSNVDNII